MNVKFRIQFAKWFWLIFVTGLLFVVFFFVGIAKGWFGYMPPLEDLQNPKNKYASEVFSNDAVSLGRCSPTTRFRWVVTIGRRIV